MFMSLVSAVFALAKAGSVFDVAMNDLLCNTVATGVETERRYEHEHEHEHEHDPFRRTFVCCVRTLSLLQPGA